MIMRIKWWYFLLSSLLLSLLSLSSGRLQPCFYFSFFTIPLYQQSSSPSASSQYPVPSIDDGITLIFSFHSFTDDFYFVTCYSTNSAIVGSVFTVSQMVFTLFLLTIPLFQKSSSPSASSTSLVMHEVHVGALSIIQIHNLPTPHWPQDYKYSQKLQLNIFVMIWSYVT